MSAENEQQERARIDRIKEEDQRTAKIAEQAVVREKAATYIVVLDVTTICGPTAYARNVHYFVPDDGLAIKAFVAGLLAEHFRRGEKVSRVIIHRVKHLVFHDEVDHEEPHAFIHRRALDFGGPALADCGD